MTSIGSGAIVVCLRFGGEAVSAELLAGKVRSAMDRASVGGARLIGVGSDGASFGFDDGATEEAIDLALAVVAETNWRVGIAVGDLATVREEDAFERLSVGSAAIRAAALARIASPGEILVDATIREAAAGSLLSTGRRLASIDDGDGKRMRAVVLDLHEPWRRGSEGALERIHEPRVVGRESSIAMVEAVEPGGLAIVHAAPGVGGTRFLEEIGARAARSLLIEPTMGSVEPLGALRYAFARAQQGRARELPGRYAGLLDRLLLGRGLDVEAASELIRAWIGEGFGSTVDERAWLLIDDATLVDRSTLEAVGHAASGPGVAFAIVARIDANDVLPTPLAGVVVEADLSLKALLPHEANVVLEEACGGGASVSPEVVRRWVRRGGGVPLAILESLRHGLTVGDLAVRAGLTGSSIVARSRASGRGRVLSAHAWIARRLAVLEADRAHDALITAVVALAGPGVDYRVVEEACVDLGVPGGAAFTEAVARLARAAILIHRGDVLSPSSRTLRDAAVDRIAEGTRRRIHTALSGALAREALGLDLAEGAHHAALAGDHMGATALAMRTADRARKAGLGQWASEFEAFARAQGGTTAPMPTTPSPPPRPTIPSPRPPPVESLPPSELESLPDEELSTGLTPPPPPGPPEPPPPERLQRHSIGVTNLTTGQIAALPAPYTPPRDLYAAAIAPPPELEELDEDDTDSLIIIEDELPPVAPTAPTALDGVGELARAAREALASRDLPALDAALSAIEVVAGPSAAVTRMRAIAALARGKVVDGLELARRAVDLDPSAAARSRLALSVALGVAGDRQGALIEALGALAAERRRTGASGPGDEACRRLVSRIVDASAWTLSPPEARDL